jgi:hypothetical protein
MVYENGEVVRAEAQILKGQSSCSKGPFKSAYKWSTHYKYLCQLFGQVNQRHSSYFEYRLFNLTPQSRVLLEKLTGFAANQEIPRIYGTTRKFITVFMTAHHLSLF